MTRRQLLALAAQSALVPAAVAEPTPVERRITALIHEFEDQGDHRTATAVDIKSGDWLFEQVRSIGAAPTREHYPLDRVDVTGATLTVGDRRIGGVPLFDCIYTGPQGIRGRVGPLGSDAPIGWGELVPNAADGGALGEARRANRHKAIIVTTKGARPGLCPSNAYEFLKPYGPPVLQIPGGAGDTPSLLGADVTVVATAKRTATRSFNVLTTLKGKDSSLPPVVVMTPRSGWWSCASERGGGILCWLELIRNLKGTPLNRDILFVASSGHEIGHMGIVAYIDNRPGLAKQARAWIHFGANIGAAQDPGNNVQTSDDEFQALQTNGMKNAGLAVSRVVPHTRMPGGESREIFKAGGRFISQTGGNGLFHNPLDRGPAAIDANVIARFATVFTDIAKHLAA